MSRVKTWLVSDKRFFNFFRADLRKLPDHCRSFLFSSDIATVNYSSYLSYLFFQKKFTQGDSSSTLPSTPSAPRVPPTGGTLSFHKENMDGISLAEEQKILWLFEIEKIPPRHREGLLKILQKHRPAIFLCSVFNPTSFSYELAEKSDFYFIKKRSWIPFAKQLKSVFRRVIVRQPPFPILPERFTLKEKLVMRLLWKFRDSFINITEISSYLYGKKMPKNLHSSEEIISELQAKLRRITDRKNAIRHFRNYGYRIEGKAWKEMLRHKS